MNKTYTFSCYVKRDVPVLKRRPWWNLFGRDTLTTARQWVRMCLTDITEDEKDLILGGWDAPAVRLLRRAVGSVVANVQLEEDVRDASPYVTTGTLGTPYAGARRVRNLTAKNFGHFG